MNNPLSRPRTMTTDERLTEAFELIKDLKFVIESNQDRIKAMEASVEALRTISSGKPE